MFGASQLALCWDKHLTRWKRIVPVAIGCGGTNSTFLALFRTVLVDVSSRRLQSGICR